MKIKDDKLDLYNKGYNNNLDAYGHAVYTYANRWADLLERDIEEMGDAQAAIIKNAEKRADEADTEGITGFMYGCAVSILSQCWEYGEELRIWHNKEYNYQGDSVVNPAILTVAK